jgi:ferredoxin
VSDPQPRLAESADRDSYRREGLLEPAPSLGASHEGTGRVDLTFLPAERTARVPPGVTVFDGASWNGIAIDSTCGGHGTCKKCKVQI